MNNEYGKIKLASLITDATNKLFTSEYSNYVNDIPFLIQGENIVLPYSKKADLDYMKSVLTTNLENRYIIHVIGNRYLSRDLPNGSSWRPLKLYEIVFIDNCSNQYIFRTNEYYKLVGSTHTLVDRTGSVNTRYYYIENELLCNTILSNMTIDIIKNIQSNIYKVDYDSQFKNTYMVKINNNTYEDIFKTDANYTIINSLKILDNNLRKEKEFFVFSESLLQSTHDREINNLKNELREIPNKN
jgi:hypothetical protein